MKTDSPMRNFDPRKVAHYEVQNYVAYYQKDWPKLLKMTVGLVKESFGLSLPQAVKGAYLVARAEMAAAPFPNNDIPKSESYMQRFYALLKRIYPSESFDPIEAARLDVRWWVIHRQLFANPDNQPLVDALADLWAYAYNVPREHVMDAAYHRAQGMLISDRWVRAGKDVNSLMLREEEEELYRSYAALLMAVTVAPAAQMMKATATI